MQSRGATDDRARRVMNWPALGRETVDLLPRYLMLDTTNPPGNETEGTRFLATCSIATVSPSRDGGAGARARQPGGPPPGRRVASAPSCCTTTSTWSTPTGGTGAWIPSAATSSDGFLYGRGALDMKSTGVLQLAAVLAIKRAQVPPQARPHPARHGRRGSGQPLRRAVGGRPAPRLARRGRVRAVRARRHRARGGRDRALREHQSSRRRRVCPSASRRASAPGHGSMPWPDTAPNRLIRALGAPARGRAPAARPARGAGILRAARLGRCRARRARGYDDLERSLRDAGFRRASCAKRLTQRCCGPRSRSRCSRAARSAT